MGRNKIFIRRKDGRIEVRLPDAGRAFVESVVRAVVASEADAEHPWHATMHAPINPTVDADDPLQILERQKLVANATELALLTVHEPFLSEAEAWAWLTTLQAALRNRAGEQSLFSDEDLAAAAPEALDTIRSLQLLLFELAEALS